jgi:RND family efflux transporter MFP subunit
MTEILSRRLDCRVRRPLPFVAALALAFVCVISPTAAADVGAPAQVSAFARLRPRDGVITVAGPTSDYGFRIARIDVKEGDGVKAGEPLAELDVKQEREASLAVAEAQAREAKVAADYAAREFERRERLYNLNSNAISGQDLDAARQAADAAAAKFDTASRQQEYARVLVDQATIRAPVDGTVLKLLEREGEGLAAGAGLLELGDIEHMQAVAEVFETDAHFVKPGQITRFESRALPAPAHGVVLAVRPMVDSLTLYSTDAARNTEARIVDVILSLDDDPNLRGMTGLQGTVVIETSPGS